MCWKSNQTEIKQTSNMIALVVLNLTIVLLSLATSGLCYSSDRYAGFSLYRSLPQTEAQLEKLHTLMVEKDGEEIDFWTEPVALNRSVDIMVSPNKEYYLREQLRAWKIPTKLIMHDIGEILRRSIKLASQESLSFRENTNVSCKTFESGVFHRRYNRYAEIEDFLYYLKGDPRVSVETIGRSSENRNLYLVKVSTDADANKPVIFIDAGHHAREWISHATLLYMLDILVTSSAPTESIDNTIENGRFSKSLVATLEKYDYWFLPVVNPDGYEYSHIEDRLWRKSRSGSSSFYGCVGTDLNRNYDFHWSETGSSSSSCSPTYAGPMPFSEPETRAVAGVLDENACRIKMYITLHAFSQMILLPYGYGPVRAKNHKELKRIGDAGRRAIRSYRGTSYRVDTTAIILYPASGGSDDYAHGHSNISLSFTIELPDTGESGFLMPPNEIVPIGRETSMGIAAMVNAIEVSKFG